jgi:DUF1680 family protein
MRQTSAGFTRRSLFASSTLAPLALAQDQAPFEVDAGVDRIVVLPARQPGITWLHGWAGTGLPPSTTRPRNGVRPSSDPQPATGVRVEWTKASGPAGVRFADPSALDTTASFTAPGHYVLRLEVRSPAGAAASTLQVDVEPAPPGPALEPFEPASFEVTSPFWKARLRGLSVNWIPHCIRQINRDDLETGPGGIDNFVGAGKKLRGEPHGRHKGYVFSNAWVYQTIEAICLALGYPADGDPEVEAAHKLMRATLDHWIPIILGAQEPDGYLQTAFTLPRSGRDGALVDTSRFKHWDPARRPDHEGYVAGYLLEAAICHHRLTAGKDTRLFNAARKLADCWDRNLGPAPKKPWYDEHQGMEQALVRFGRYINEIEGAPAGQRYIQLARFLLDSRYHTAANPRERNEYSQSHLPVVEQYEAVGHAVRAAYTYSAMADIAIQMGDPDYRSAAKSLWSNITHRKRYLTGGTGSGETSEGFGPNFSLRNRAYCESCSSCGELFFQWKLNRLFQHARFADLYEETLYNALAGSMDLEAKHFYYDNPLEARAARYQWHVCPCCVGNVPRTLLMLPTWMYSHTRSAIFVNLYAGSKAKVGGIELVQHTHYPWNGQVAITVNPASPRRFRLHLRIPDRNASALYRATPAASGLPSFRVNGTPAKAAFRHGYGVLDRQWKPGDRIEFELPLSPQRVHPHERIQSLRGKTALRFGPLIYNIEHHDQDITQALPPAAPLRAEWKPGLLGGVVVIHSQFATGNPLLAIPNHARMNREPGTPLPPAPPPPQPGGSRPPPPPPKSIVWINES